MQQLEELPGHVLLKTHLKKLLPTPPNTLLFKGPKGVGKASVAKAFAHALLSDASPHKLTSGNHPDLREYYPEGKSHMHPMQAMKQLIHEAQRPPFESQRKVFILYDVERMLPSSSNALLKTLEEPPSWAHFILVTSHPEQLLPTITSRCFSVPFSLLPDEELQTYLEKQVAPDEARQLTYLAQGSLKKAHALLEKKDAHLFALLADIGVAAVHQSYPTLFRLLSDLEKQIEKDNPEAIEEVLSALYYWYRDLHLLKAGGNASLLFFRAQEDELKKCLNCPLPPLEELQAKMRRIREALICHISLRHCLMELLV